ncbi:hypothetical protein AC249_AIPGENE3754 [Exaiptasia diaphana]|nr:hypothetical protein AC249_AIPGENE3754 [Exaiptasia diaphana]
MQFSLPRKKRRTMTTKNQQDENPVDQVAKLIKNGELEEIKKITTPSGGHAKKNIDSEPAPKGFLTAIVSEKRGKEFFYNKEYLAKFNITANSKRDKVPGHAYFEKVESFFESHYEKGELYMEFLKDASQLPNHHYLPTEKTPMHIDDGNLREPDDYQPRAQLRKLYAEGEIGRNN